MRTYSIADTRQLHVANASAATELPSQDGQSPAIATEALVLAPIDLSRAEPLASGSERHIFNHPSDDSLLIKVINEDERSADLDASRFKRWRKTLQRDGLYRVYKSELAEYISAVSQARQSDRPVPLARIVGLTETSLGLGMIVEKIRCADTGAMAPTLADLVKRDGLTDALVERLDAFFLDLADSHVIVNDPSARNIVFGVNAAGRSGIFLIDGFGQKQAVPVMEWSKSLNRRRVFRKYAVMLQKLRRKQKMLRDAKATEPGDRDVTTAGLH